MKIMAIGGHAGDMDLTAGPALVQAVMDGHEVVLLHLTPGEKGHPTLGYDAYALQKSGEATAFANHIGARARFLPYRDGELPVTDQVKFEVAELIREEKPQIVVTHWKNSIHKDHANTYLIVEDAIFYAEINTYASHLSPHSVRQVYYADNWEDPFDYQPDIYVELRDEAYQLWLKAAEQYAYARGETGFQHLEYYKALFVVRGLPHGSPRAVAFARPDWSRLKKITSLTERG